MNFKFLQGIFRFRPDVRDRTRFSPNKEIDFSVPVESASPAQLRKPMSFPSEDLVKNHAVINQNITCIKGESNPRRIDDKN